MQTVFERENFLKPIWLSLPPYQFGDFRCSRGFFLKVFRWVPPSLCVCFSSMSSTAITTRSSAATPTAAAAFYGGSSLAASPSPPPPPTKPVAVSASDVLSDKAVAAICGLASALMITHGNQARDVLVAYHVLRRFLHGAPSQCYVNVCAALETRPCKEMLVCCEANDVLVLGEPVGEATARAAAELDLSRAYMGVRGALCVVATVPLLLGLQRLVWRYGHLDSNLTVLLAHGCTASHLPLLRRIDVSFNPIGSVGAAALLELVVSHNGGIVSIEIEGVEMVGALHRRLRDACARNAAASVGAEQPPAEASSK